MRLMTSTGLPANGDPGNEQAREPKGDELVFITPAEARKKWGDRVWEMEGVTWLFNDGQCESEHPPRVEAVHLADFRRHRARVTRQSSTIITISRPSSCWESGERTLRSVERSSRTDRRPCLHPPGPGSSE